MKLSVLVAAALAVGVPAALALSIPVPPPVKATPVSGDTARGENLGLLCEEGARSACRELVALTGGNCAVILWVSETREQRIKRWVASGLSQRAVAKRLNVSRYAVSKALAAA